MNAAIGAYRHSSGCLKPELTTPMTGHKHRVTIASICGTQRVWPAVSALLQVGVRPGQISLAAMACALQSLAANDRALTSLHPDLQQVQRCLSLSKPAGPSADVEATPGPLLACLGQVLAPPSSTLAVGARYRFSNDLKPALESYILAGCVIVGVESNQADQQWASVRVLLGQNTDEVRTFEFTPFDCLH